MTKLTMGPHRQEEVVNRQRHGRDPCFRQMMFSRRLDGIWVVC